MNKFILQILSDVGTPVAFENYTGSESTYIRFFYLPQGQFSADDDEKHTTHFVQVDIFTPGNYIALANETKKLMKQAGFRKNFEHSQYENDTKLYHKILRFWIIKEDI